MKESGLSSRMLRVRSEAEVHVLWLPQICSRVAWPLLGVRLMLRVVSKGRGAALRGRPLPPPWLYSDRPTSRWPKVVLQRELWEGGTVTAAPAPALIERTVS